MYLKRFDEQRKHLKSFNINYLDI